MVVQMSSCKCAGMKTITLLHITFLLLPGVSPVEEPGKPCVFPFLHNGKNHTKCLDKGRKSEFCATTYYYDRDTRWRYCTESDRATSPPPATPPPPTPTAPPSTPTAPPLPPQVNVGVLAGDVVGYCGGGVSIRCEYDTQYGQRPKYFCQGEQAACRELIRTSTKGKWVSKDRFTLFDNGTHYFIVSISELATSDSARYQCGVSVLEGEPVQTEVNLKVKDEVSNCGITMVKTAFVGETLNVTCPYLDVHEHAGKYLCKAFHGQSCNYKVSAQADSTWVHSDKVSVFDDRKGRVFTALLSNLGMYDRGSYWCGVETGWEHGGEDGYRALIRKLQLTVRATRPLNSGTTESYVSAWTTADPETTSTPLSALSTAEDTTLDAALLLLPSLFREDSNFIYCIEEPVSPNPTIVFHGSLNALKAENISIHLDGKNIVKGKLSIPESIECLFCVYFLFNVSYPTPIINTLTFIEKFLLKLPNNTKIPLPVLKMHNQLMSYN